MSPLALNAFDLIILSQGLNLGTMFDRGQVWLLVSIKFPDFHLKHAAYLEK